MAPKIQQPQKIVYPLGVKDISDDLGVDELVRRLKTCAQSFQSMNQDDDNKNYVILAIHLAQEAFLEHSSKDVRLLIACCIADVFRVYAPDAPYKDPEHLKAIFIFLIHQLRGLEDPKDPAFKRYFYLLENLAWVKSFNICIELEDNQEIFCQLFKLLFKIVNDDHSTKVKNFMLDMMCPLISEADSVSQELLDVILSNIIEPRKTQNKNAYNLAKDLLKRTAPTIEPYIQAFFNNSLILGKAPDTDIGNHLYDLIYELNSISPSVLLAVLPQLEFKLKSNDEKERLDVTRLLARMFSDKDSELAVQHQSLWNCFLGRFNDISVAVRTRCVQYSMHFLLNHPELTKDITEQLKLRQHDPEETVRYEVVMAIVSAAKKEFSRVSEELLTFVKERTLDKKFKIRKEALLGLSVIYKQCMTTEGLDKQTLDCVSWIKNKVLHVYYQTALDDRLLVERILHTCLVPYQLDTEERMKKLFQLYSTVDDHAVKAFNELLKCQNIVRSHVRSLLELIGDESNEEKEKNMTQKIAVLAKSLPEPVKTQEFIKKFVSTLQMDKRLRSQMEVIMKHDCSCKEAEESVREILKKLGNPVMTNVFYMTVKKMLERVAPVMIDRAAIEVLIDLVSKMLNYETEDGLETCKPERGLKLLYTLSWVFPGAFQCSDIYSRFVNFLQMKDELAAEMTLQIFANIGSKLEAEEEEIALMLVPMLKEFACTGSMKQAKYAVRCLVTICRDRFMIFEHSLDELKKYLSLESPHFCTALVSVGHIAYYCPDLFGSQMKTIVSKVVVKELLMQDRDIQRSDGDGWCPEDELSDETKAKIEGMKLMVRWLLGLKTSTNSAISSLKLLTTVIMHDGDLMEKGKITTAEKAWLRYMAGCCILKLCQEPTYADILTPEQFNTVAQLLNDECKDVRDRFSQKLHKGLIGLKLPLDFMAIFALAGNESTKDLKTQLTHNLQANVNKRRDYLKQHTLTNDKMFQFLPDYVLPYAIHLLAHDPEYKKYDNVKHLQSIKECLWFLMEPLMTNNENYSFGFFKKLLENIKQTKDAQSPADDMQNMKLYAVCDLALSIVLSKTTNFVLVEHPVEPKLPSKLFTEVDRTHANTKTYLPPELTVNPPKQSALGARRGRPRLTRDSDTGRLRRTATNGNAEEVVATPPATTIDLNADEDEPAPRPSKKQKLDDAEKIAVPEDNNESKDDKDEEPELESELATGANAEAEAEVEVEAEAEAEAEAETEAEVAAEAEAEAPAPAPVVEIEDVVIPMEIDECELNTEEIAEKSSSQEEPMVIETDLQEEEKEKEEKENDEQNNQRPRRSTNRKDDDFKDKGGGSGSGGGNQQQRTESENEKSNLDESKGSSKETTKSSSESPKTTKEDGNLKQRGRIGTRGSTQTISKRLRSSSSADNKSPAKTMTKKRKSLTPNKTTTKSSPPPPPQKNASKSPPTPQKNVTKSPPSPQKSTISKKPLRSSPAESSPKGKKLRGKYAEQIQKKLRKAAAVSNGVVHRELSSGDDSSPRKSNLDDSPRKSSRIQAKFTESIRITKKSKPDVVKAKPMQKQAAKPMQKRKRR